MSQLRIAPFLILATTPWTTVPGWDGDAFGSWEVNSVRSLDPGSRENLTMRFEPHTKGEVFTLNRTDERGRFTTSSTLLYFDGKPRNIQDFACSGTQSSRRLDEQTVEILRTCTGGEWVRFIRRLSAQSTELVVQITEQQADGRRFERRLVMKKQSGAGAIQTKQSANERSAR